MIKSPFIFFAKPSRFGDIICSLPLLAYLKKQFLESYITVFVDQSCWQIAPLLFNDPKIDKIQISEQPNRVTENEIRGLKEYDIVFNTYPQLTKPDYYNYWSVQRENFLISETLEWNTLRWQKIDSKCYDNLTEEEKRPQLTSWFPIKKEEKTIAIWPFVGTNLNDETSQKRSPSLGWWIDMVVLLKSRGYKVKQFGHPNSPHIEVCGVQDCRNLSLFDAIKESLGCNVCLGTDSGSMHILGAYGILPQICLYTTWKPNHIMNPTAFLPMNSKNNLIGIYNKNLSAITKEEVWDKIKEII